MKFWAVVLLALLGAGCGPRCLRGHDEIRRVPEHCYPVPWTIGEVTIWVPHCDPAHDVQVFVCDQYELEKAE